MGGNELLRAKRLFSRKKYASVIRMLEPQVFRFRENPDFYFLLGASCFHSKDISGARTYMQRVVDLKKDDLKALSYLAVIFLRQRKNKEAIETWLGILEIDHNNRYAKKGLDLLKKSTDNQQLIDDFLYSNKITNLLPKKVPIFPIVITPIIIAFILTPVILFLNRDFSIGMKESRNDTVREVMGTVVDEYIDDEGKFDFVFTEKELETMLKDAEKYFNDYEDNRAQIIVNKIKRSNASAPVKDKAELLERYLSKPDFTNFTGEISYADIFADPLNYENCYVKWKGKVSNVSIGEESIRFDFLVGYHENKILEGIVPVKVNFAVDLEQGSAIEIIGKVEFVERKPSLSATSIRPIAEEK